jgi:hypothetical protein
MNFYISDSVKRVAYMYESRLCDAKNVKILGSVKPSLGVVSIYRWQEQPCSEALQIELMRLHG